MKTEDEIYERLEQLKKIGRSCLITTLLEVEMETLEWVLE